MKGKRKNPTDSSITFEGKGIEPTEDEIVVTGKTTKTNGKTPLTITYFKTYRRKTKKEETT